MRKPLGQQLILVRKNQIKAYEKIAVNKASLEICSADGTRQE